MSPEAAPLVIDDPMEAPRYGDGPLSRWCRDALFDPRDEVFVRLSLRVVTIMTLAMIGLFAALHFDLAPWWAVVPVYLALWGWLSAPVILMLHNTMHRPFLRKPRWLNQAHPYVMSFFFGIPTGYADHHLGMHHAEDNMPEDLSSTMRYRRDSFLHFLVYFARFLFLIIIELPLYLSRKHRRRMARRAVRGEMGHVTVIALAMWADFHFGLVAFLIPTLSVRFLMMVGNWGQHAFLNTARKNDGLSNAITCINAGYNQRAFNDGYHIGHHLKGNRHWTELPKELLDNREAYVRAGAIVFRGLDFFLVSILLWTKQWGVLARRYVRLDRPMSDDEVIALLKSRVMPVREWPALDGSLDGAVPAAE
jgi:fatty acid desaturase